MDPSLFSPVVSQVVFFCFSTTHVNEGVPWTVFITRWRPAVSPTTVVQ